MSDLELGKKRAEELGLRTETVRKYYSNPAAVCEFEAYHSGDIHRLLGSGRDSMTLSDNEDYDSSACNRWWLVDKRRINNGTHMGLLIGIRPIVQESEERKLLRGFLNRFAMSWTSHRLDNIEINDKDKMLKLIEQAKALLERKGE